MLTTPTLIPLSRAASAMVGSFVPPDGSIPSTPFFVLNPVASAVPAAAESVTEPPCERVDIRPRTPSSVMARGPLPAASLYSPAASTCASPIPSPMKRKTYLARSSPPKAEAARRSNRIRVNPIDRKKRFTPNIPFPESLRSLKSSIASSPRRRKAAPSVLYTDKLGDGRIFLFRVL